MASVIISFTGIDASETKFDLFLYLIATNTFSRSRSMTSSSASG
jgi:hypothetical protein